MALQPYTGTFGPNELQHLLRRSLFGATPADLAHFEGQSMDNVVDALLDLTNDTTPPVKTYSELNGGVPDPSLVDPQIPFGTTWTTHAVDPTQPIDPNGYRLASFMAWWTGQMVQQDRTLREKLVLFYQGFLVTQSYAVFNGNGSYTLNQQYRTQAIGNFKQLLYDVTLEPAMLVYLNGYLNVQSAPDENYGRELMELFTLGEGSGYTEADVHAAARVLTGWTVSLQTGGVPTLPTTIFRQLQHDNTNKVFSSFFDNTVITGQSGPSAGPNELNELLDMIFAKEEASRFICRKLYRFFVHSDIDATVEAQVIEPLAEIFRNNMDAPDQMRTVIRALLTSAWFYDAEIRACMIKSPADHVIGTARVLGLAMPPASQPEAQYFVWAELFWLMNYTGQLITDPPNVAGWPAYRTAPAFDRLWLDNTTYPARRNVYLYLCYSGITTPSAMVQTGSQDQTYGTDLVAFTQQFNDPSDPNSLLDDAAWLLFAVDISDAVKAQLKTNFLLLGQSNDQYWTTAYETYVADSNTGDMTAQLVPAILLWLLTDMQGAAESNLF